MCRVEDMSTIKVRLKMGNAKAIADELHDIKIWCDHQERMVQRGWYQQDYAQDVERVMSGRIIDALNMNGFTMGCNDIAMAISDFRRGINTLSEFADRVTITLHQHLPVAFI